MFCMGAVHIILRRWCLESRPNLSLTMKDIQKYKVLLDFGGDVVAPGISVKKTCVYRTCKKKHCLLNVIGPEREAVLKNN